jgi:hypothetical protein
MHQRLAPAFDRAVARRERGLQKLIRLELGEEAGGYGGLGPAPKGLRSPAARLPALIIPLYRFAMYIVISIP